MVRGANDRAKDRVTDGSAAGLEVSTGLVGGLVHGLAVIEAFDEGNSEMSLTEVAKRARLTPATARRSLHTLLQLGYAARIGKRYALAARVMSLGFSYLRSAGIERALQPEIVKISKQLGNPVGFALLQSRKILYLAHSEDEGQLRPTARVGTTYPAYATALGRILLAYSPIKRLDDYLAFDDFNKITDYTETDPVKLREKILCARKLGYAGVRDELFLGVTAIAVPILHSDGTLLAALNLSTYSGDTSLKQLVKSRLSPLQNAARSLSSMVVNHRVLHYSLKQSMVPPTP